MTNYRQMQVTGLHDFATSALIGFVGADGKEYLFNSIAIANAASYGDSSGTPGAATLNTVRGRCAIAIAASTVVITNSLVTTTSTVVPILESLDATLTTLLRVLPAAGSFTITGNGVATAPAIVRFIVFNN